MRDASWVIRRAVARDGSFLTDMLVEAVNWSPEWKPRSRRRILAESRTARYVAGWPRDSDLGVIAEGADPGPAGAAEPAGAAWLRFLPAAEPGGVFDAHVAGPGGAGRGYGFVAEDVPELTIGVAASWRGRGVGRALLRALDAEARGRGITRISLSVERKNYAQRLYLSEGYRVVDATDKDADTMIKDL